MVTIYKITSPSGKIYIGQTLNFKRRLAEYKRNRCTSQKLLYASINKYGYAQHIFEEIEKVSLEEADNREIYWISHYNSFQGKNGLNLTPGGKRPAPKKGAEHYKAKPLYQYSLLGEFIKKWNCLTDAAISLNLNRNVLGNAVKSKLSYKNFLWSFQKTTVSYNPKKGGFPSKTIYQYDINGNFIKSFNSILQASKELGICRNGIKKSLKNLPIKRVRSPYKWSYNFPLDSHVV